MLHSPITEVSANPDIAQAVEDKLADLAEIRDLIVAEVRLNAQHPTPRIERIAELFGEIVLRSERIDIDPPALIGLISAELDRRNGGASIAGEVRSRLLRDDREARDHETEAQNALVVAQRAVATAQLARVHAEARCLAFGLIQVPA